MANFSTPASMTLDDLAATFRKWGVTRWNANRGDRRSTVATVWFVHPSGAEVELRADHFEWYADNLRALWQSLDQARKDEGRGLGGLARSLYLQLPAPAAETPPAAPESQGEHDPYMVLGIREDATLEDAEAMYRAKCKRLGWDPSNGAEWSTAFYRLNAAISAVRGLLAVKR